VVLDIRGVRGIDIKNCPRCKKDLIELDNVEKVV